MNKRKEFIKKVSKINLDDIISIDETSIDNQLYPLYGWGTKGIHVETIRNAVRSRYSVITAISKNKVIHYEIIKNSTNALHFKSFIETLVKKGITNTYLLMDNARIHHAKIVKDYVRTTSNILLYNAPYTPEYNPIERVFSKLKSILRTKTNNSNKQIIQNIKVAFNKITKTELKNYYDKSLNIKKINKL